MWMMKLPYKHIRMISMAEIGYTKTIKCPRLQLCNMRKWVISSHLCKETNLLSHCSRRGRVNFCTIWRFSKYKGANQKVVILVHISFLSILLLFVRGKHHIWLRLSVCFSYILYDVFSQNPLHYVHSYISTGSSWISLLLHVRVLLSLLIYISSGQGHRSKVRVTATKTELWKV